MDTQHKVMECKPTFGAEKNPLWDAFSYLSDIQETHCGDDRKNERLRHEINMVKMILRGKYKKDEAFLEIEGDNDDWRFVKNE